LIDAGIRRFNGELHGAFQLSARFGGNPFECGSIGMFLLGQPTAMQFDRIPFGLPVLLLALRAVVLAIDVSNVMPAVTIRVCL
jgi:hypothetical protein